MTKKEKQAKSLFTYAVILLIGVMIIIVIAAMADHREQVLNNNINEAKSTNAVIQEELIQAKDENYNLKNENEALKADSEELKKLDELNKVWNLYKEGKKEEALEELKKIPTDAMGETENAYYSALCEVLNFGKEEN